MVEMGAPVKDVLEAAKDASYQIVREGKISPETLSIVSRELMPKDDYIQVINQRFHELLNKIDKQELTTPDRFLGGFNRIMDGPKRMIWEKGKGSRSYFLRFKIGFVFAITPQKDYCSYRKRNLCTNGTQKIIGITHQLKRALRRALFQG
jgi:hypothetical protein